MPNRVAASVATASSCGSGALNQHRLRYIGPAPAQQRRAFICFGREEDASDARREFRIGKNLFEIVDKMSAVEPGDARELRRSRFLEKDILAPKSETVRVEEPMPGHPAERRLAQVDAGRIEVPVAGLMAHHEYLKMQRTASAQKHIRAFEQHRATDTGAVNMALQPLPRDLTIRQLAYRVAHFALRPKKIRRHEAALARRRE